MSRVHSSSARWSVAVVVVVGLVWPLTVGGQPLPVYPQLPNPQGSQAAPAPAPAPTPTPAAPAKPASPGAPAADRDPFEPLVTKAPEGEARPSLSGVRLVGVIWDPARKEQIRALVETPDGLGYYVRMNEEKFGGKVVAIERDRVRFAVREQDPSGQNRVRTVELKLSQ
jgi:Tfp pilus assembly protein PilP